MPFAETGGARLHYRSSGAGEPLLLITGLGGDLGFWRTATALLEDEYNVIAFDNRGAGGTSCHEGAFSMAELADDAAALLDHLKVDRAHVLGWSMGGNIAQEFALRHPRRVMTLTLASTYMRRPSRSSYAIARIIEAGRALGAEAVAPLMNALCMSEEHFRRRESGRNGNGRQAYDVEGMERQLQALDDYDANGRASSIGAPCLVIHGEDDIMVPVRFGEELADAIPRAEMLRVPGAGHILRPEHYLDGLRSFLRQGRA